MVDLKIIAPVVSIPVECTLDRIIARDTARRVAGALGFMPALQAQIGSVALNLTELLLGQGIAYELEFFGVRDNTSTGMCLSCPASWLENYSPDQITSYLQSKFAHLVDGVEFQSEQESFVLLTFWQTQ